MYQSHDKLYPENLPADCTRERQREKEREREREKEREGERTRRNKVLNN